jgi:hypothetical protein
MDRVRSSSGHGGATKSGEELTGTASFLLHLGPPPSGPRYISESHFSRLPASIERFSSSFCMTATAYAGKVDVHSLLQLAE